jgi:hypothetical protein
LKKIAFLGGAVGLGLVALLAAQRSQAADHLDSPSVSMPSPNADINDVFTWMDGPNLNLAMSVSPADVETRTFGPDVQYVFHVHSKPQLGVGVQGVGSETRVICTFASNTSAQCWVVEGTTIKDYVTGDPSSTAGITSPSGKVHLFAGRRSDPFFFNLQGFRAAIAALTTRFGQNPQIQYDAAGCPTNLSNNETAAVAGLLDDQIAGQPPCAATGKDCFANLNVKIILVQLDKSLVNNGQNTAVGVWASTHAAP